MPGRGVAAHLDRARQGDDRQYTDGFYTEVPRFEIKTSAPLRPGRALAHRGMDYGGIHAVFDDTCGNLINLDQG